MCHPPVVVMNPSTFTLQSRRRGIALVTVISVVALMTVLIVAMLSISQTELKSANTSANGQQARQLSEVAVNLVIAQLRKATSQNVTSTGWETWASQPGLVRRFTTGGQTQEAYKLYSSSQLVLRDAGNIEPKLLTDVVPGDWQTYPHRFVDLNRPAVRAAADGSPLLLFPILDPRAQTGSANSTVGGFSYRESYPGDRLSGQPVGGVRTSGGDSQRVPMPVEWLYVLKDGSLGTLNSQNEFVGQVVATERNPITGRIAFWTDDESTKVNVNTASEPTSWAIPTFFYDHDADYARFQPLAGEFQRYPGHPATTALSPVLAPLALGQLTLTPAQKESVYDLVPKVGPGGSKGGTKAYSDPDTVAVALSAYRREHLYASLDELLLADTRLPNKLGSLDLTQNAIQRAGFFLTAQSRAPEANPFGLPKIAAWPVSYLSPTRGLEYRTSFDQLIAHCSTLRRSGSASSRNYIFQRSAADSLTEDVTRPENTELLTYLQGLLARPIPGFSTSAGQTFSAKYGEDTDQILVEIFDYIRGINLHDGNLVKATDRFDGEGKAQNFMLGYAPGSARPTNFKTYTDPRFFAADPDNPDAVDGQVERQGFPGHGQTTPSRWVTGSHTVQGIGRFPTITEVGLQFICVADNTDDPNNTLEEKYDFIGKPGGGSAPKLPNGTSPPPQDRWYSNFPPRTINIPGKDAGNGSLYPLTGGYPYGPNPQHPGYKKVNWNRQLNPDTPLRPGFRRIQARLLLEFFVPAAGYTILEPELTVRINGLDKFIVNNSKRLFPRSQEIMWSSRRAIHQGNQRMGGYGIGVTGMQTQRFAPARYPMPADNQWGADAWEVKPTTLPPGDELCVINYDLVSDFVDVEVGLDGALPMVISEAPLVLELWSGHYGRVVSKTESPASVVQNLKVRFPTNTVKAPTLVRNTAPAIGPGNVVPDVEPISYWTFYSKGCMGFDSDTILKATAVRPDDQRGRFWNSHNKPPYAGAARPAVPRKGAFFYGYDAATPGAPRIFRPRGVLGNSQLEIDLAEETEGSDVVQTMQIIHGDYRVTAALPEVTEDMWKAHRFYGQRRLAHNFTKHVSDQLPGYDYGGGADMEKRLVANAAYPTDRLPDLPYFEEAYTKAQRYGDFDNGPGTHRDGPYINKPDEGNLNIVKDNGGVGYFSEEGQHRTTEKDFYSPNRMIPSPVMFGSLPSGVKANDPWRTLLFRPQQGHPGGPSKLGGNSPADHLLLEFFWMPVVEPYAISEPFSTAGKVNMNYQMFPFTHIRRATGMYAVLAGEEIHAVPDEDAPNYKVFPNQADKNAFWGSTQGKLWHYAIDVEKTLAQFEERFAQGRAFVSPSEICDIHLVPKGAGGISNYSQMENFWKQHRLTGDNIRERPYAGIYPRVTTRSNTFRVHYIAQTLKKARSSGPARMDDELDKISGEFRGSTLIERHLDPTQPNLPDFATVPAGVTLDNYHEFRVLQTQRFGF